MKKRLFLAVWLVSFSFVLIWAGCKKKDADPSAPQTSVPGNQGTPTPTPILGSFVVQVNDRTGGLGGVTVIAVPPDNSVTYTVKTQTGGFAYVSPPYIQPGNWSLEVPAQKYFADSKITAAVTAAYQAVTFTSVGAPASIFLTPTTSPMSFANTGGGAYTYNLVYQQPGNLLVPIKLAFSSMPNNWAGAGPASVGFLTTSDQVAITVTGSVCVDQADSFAVTGLDFEPTPYVPAGALSSPTTITKGFTTNVSVTWYQPNFSHISSCNLETTNNAGTLTVSISNGCGTVDVWVQEPSTNCTSGQWNTPNGNTNAQGSHITFGAGSYSCKYISDGGFPTFYARCNTNGATGSTGIGNGTFTVLNTSY